MHSPGLPFETRPTGTRAASAMFVPHEWFSTVTLCGDQRGLTDTGEDPSRLQSTDQSSGQNLWSGSLLKTLSSVTETLAGFCVWIHHWRRVIVLVGGCLLIIDWQRLSMYELATCRRLEAGYWEVTGISRWSSWIYRRFVYFWSSPMWRLLRWAVSPSAMIGRCEE